MVEQTPPGDDPFGREDPEAAEREARRRLREAKRRERQQRIRGESVRRSLAERVGPRTDGDEDAEGAHAEGAAPPGAVVSGAEVEPIAEPEPEPERVPSPAVAAPGRSGRITGAWERYRPVAAVPTDRRTMILRRLLAAGAVVGALVVVALLVRAVDGGSDPAPVPAVEPLKTISVLVPEGLTLDQIAAVAKDAKLKGSYEKAAKEALEDFPLTRYGAQDAPSLEGFLFPATYELEKGAPASDLVAKQLEAFGQNFGGVNLRAAAKKNLTPYDVLTIASMIEREVQVPEERPLVAAVIYNRLAAGDTLGIDATLRYELGNYDEQLLQSELDAPTPYNTRINPGLPPTPIGNPGLAAIEAAAKPADSDVYYFVVEPGTCGEHFFTADAAEFDAAQARYQAALAAEGGSPTDCPG